MSRENKVRVSTGKKIGDREKGYNTGTFTNYQIFFLNSSIAGLPVRRTSFQYFTGATAFAVTEDIAAKANTTTTEKSSSTNADKKEKQAECKELPC